VYGVAQTSQEVNEANNPLTPKITGNLQDQYISSYHGLSDSDSNAILLRGVLPHKLFGWPQILRATVPIVTSPDQPLGSTTGLGDINLFDLFLFKAGRMELGFGPQLTIDSATDDRLGTGKWQAGAAALAIAPQHWGLLGGLVTYQHSFAGEDDRLTQNALQAQPFIIYNLPQAFYLRSTATWSFDLERGDYYIPLGLGAGKVWKTVDGATLNLFVEPQLTVAHEGVAPELQVFMGLNMQFPLRR
jgi:hypothetical protein